MSDKKQTTESKEGDHNNQQEPQGPSIAQQILDVLKRAYIVQGTTSGGKPVTLLVDSKNTTGEKVALNLRAQGAVAQVSSCQFIGKLFAHIK